MIIMGIIIMMKIIIIIIITISLLVSFSYQRQLIVFEWQQVASSLQYTSLYSNRYLQCYSLDCLDLSSDFQLFQAPSQKFRDPSKCTNYNWNHSFLSAQRKVQVII